MNRNCKDRLINITAWLIAEIALNMTGFDNLADYSEFVFERNSKAISANRNSTGTALPQIQLSLIQFA